MATAAYEVRSTTRRGLPVIELAGECDISSAPAIHAAVRQAFTEGASSLVFDLEEVTFLDSAPLGAFLSARRRAADAGGQVILLCSSPSLLRLLRLLELPQIFAFHTREEWNGASS